MPAAARKRTTRTHLPRTCWHRSFRSPSLSGNDSTSTAFWLGGRVCRAVATGSVDAAQALSGPCPSIRLALQLRTKLFAYFANFALICVAARGASRLAQRRLHFTPVFSSRKSSEAPEGKRTLSPSKSSRSPAPTLSGQLGKQASGPRTVPRVQLLKPLSD